ncbi:TatD family hydrolase [Mycobacterium yunnanensis]|uniref:TatD family hydrolase n=1 Tax=Mycobacterium yunnanensis TaxID=368477 RepID=A0A9X3BRA5_9MYCO|nr:TatD family hydrolase [Mycobacterium yunnanensis]MCV7419329.1 TatD family hydrolase [Mycobacterium yunnanensis]
MTDLGPLLDSHCHLGAYDDPVAVMDSAAAANVSLVAVTESPEEFRRLKTRLGRRPTIEVALGLHPLRAASFRPADIARFFRCMPQTRWIGEVGLDFSQHGIATKKHQLRVFDIVLTEAQPGRHPLTVHSRGAETEVVNLLSQVQLPAVMHWYTGPLKLVDDALAAGLYFSVNPAMTRSKRFASFIANVPADRILLETDGPYAKTSGRPAQPTDLKSLANQLAIAWQVAPVDAAQTLRRNHDRLRSMAG